MIFDPKTNNRPFYVRKTVVFTARSMLVPAATLGMGTISGRSGLPTMAAEGCRGRVAYGRPSGCS